MWRRFGLLLIFSSILLTACVREEPTFGEKKSDKELSEDYFRMGVGYMELGKMNIAMEKLQHSLALNPNNPNTHDALAVLYEKLEVYDKADEHFKKAIKLAPDQASTVNNYGRYLCTRGNYQEGMKYLKEAIAMPLNVRKWIALTNAGNCESSQGDKAVAEGYYRQALQLQSSYAPALKEMLILSFENENYMSTQAFLQRYEAVSEHTVETLWIAMRMAQANGDQDRADILRAQILQQFPASAQAEQVRKNQITH